MALIEMEQILFALMDVLENAADCNDRRRRPAMIAAGLRQLAAQAHLYPLRRLADQWQRVSESEEAC